MDSRAFAQSKLGSGVRRLFLLKDRRAMHRIQVRIDRAEEGNFGDCEPVGEGVSEMRIHYGPGYRVYFTRRGSEIVILLAGGDKSTQSKDIKTALSLARQY
ncbi:type II toxin-antitoxin system RelE/ParE family toxin [Bordetella ansorpii]|jgi:putative addiction module killer protein|nr:type II toxin-antitoxin system RelE/ParE family toxin [Bordetella ansorpii]